MTRVVGTPLRGVDFNSPSDEAISARVSGDTVPRIRIDAGGRITWSSGTIAGDTKLYRSDSTTLLTEGIFSASGGLVTVTTSGSPTIALPDGAIAIDTTNNVFYFRASGTWSQVVAGDGNASLTVSDTPPSEPSLGDLWFESDTGKTFVFYDSFWVEIGNSGYGDINGLVNFLEFPSDIIPITNNTYSLGSPTHRWQEVYVGPGSLYIEDAETGENVEVTISDGVINLDGTPISSAASITADSVTLGTHTTGSYVQSLIAGTGITLSNNSGEGATPTIAVGQDVGTTSNVTFNNVTVSGSLLVSGTTTTINTETLSVADNTITLNSDVTSGLPSQNAGIEVSRGASTTVTMRWNETSDVWEFTNNGTSYSTVVGTDSTQTLTNKTLTSPTITGISPVITLNGALSGSVTLTNLGSGTLTASVAADSVALGTNTTGNYVASLVAGTGVTLTNNSGESATPTVAIGQSVASSATPTFASITGTGTPGLTLSYSAGDEGGEMVLAKPQTNTSIAGTGVTIDVYQNKLRIFEQGGTARGAFIDLTTTGAGVGTDLVNKNLDNLTDVTITGTPSDKQLLVYDSATSQWKNQNPIVSTGIAYKSGVPASKTSTGTLGELAIDGANGVLYICTGTNTWQKVSLNSANFTNAGGFA